MLRLIRQELKQGKTLLQFGNWLPAGTSFVNEINLTNQPRGIQLEYRLKAVNVGGESSPSNTIAIVL